VTERTQLHRRVGEAYEKVYGATARAHLGDLAHHFCEGQPGGDVDKAIDYAVKAAEHARSSRAFQEAVVHTERALKVLDLETLADEPRRCDLLLALAEAELTLQGLALEEVKQTFGRAIALARELGMAERFAQAAIGYATSPVPGIVDQEAIGHLEEALGLLDGSDTTLRVMLLSALARQLASRSSERSLSVAVEAVESARRLGDKEPLLHALESSLGATWAAANTEDRLAVANEMLETAGELSAGKLQARLLRIRALMEMGDVRAVDAELATYSEEAAVLRTPSFLQFAKLLQAGRAIMRGDFDDAEQAAQDIIAIRARASLSASRPGDPLADYFVATLFVLRREQGRLPELEAAIEGFAKLYDVALARSSLAFLYVELGRTADARRELQRLLPEQLRETPNDWNWLMTTGLFSEVAARVDDKERAAVLYEMLRPFSTRLVLSGYGNACGGSVARYLGLLAGTLSLWDEARRHFEDAMEMNARMGARPFLAYTQHDYAQMLLRYGEPEDRERALELANQALDTARELGMKGVVDRALATKLEAQGVDSSDTYGSIHAVASAVRRERPDLTPAATPDGTVTLMFSDMEDYTGMVERLGDLAAHQLVEAHNAIVREQLIAHGGHEVELRGDGFLLAFASARQGVLCGIALHRAMAEHSNKHPEQAARVRIGLHTGEAIRDEESFFGKSVIQAFRISDLADGGKILVSSLTKELVQTAGDVKFDEGRDVELKGLSGTHRVYAVEWD
jgi:class 3 adenylate cyclase